jgi:tetratricopeptide (TPR) repeat protein
LKKQLLHIVAFTLLLFLIGCSTQKNTWLSRNTLGVYTRFNVYYNGNESYKEGLTKINAAHKEDYSGILPMYPISVHSNASAATAEMERAIEKAKKAIKLYSFKKKPTKDPTKAKDPKYIALMNQEEYNPMMDEVWLLMGKAEFHKGDFLAAVGTFTYITKHFENDKDCIAEARIWMARAYAEMGWYYEAEDLLNKVNKEQFSYRLSGLFSTVNADLLLKQKRYKEAYPFLELALEKETDKTLQTRFNYILAQLNEREKNNTKAQYYYSEVIKKNPPVEMDFNARLNNAKNNPPEFTDKSIKALNKLLKNSKYINYQDQTYYTLAKVYEQGKDTASVIKYLSLSIEKSGQNSMVKANSLIALGDIYYAKGEFIKAEPNYNEAALLLSNDHYDYSRVSRLSETLGELAIQHQIVVLQDSLQKLSTLSEKERVTVVEQLIKRIKDEEKQAQEKLKQEEEKQKQAAFTSDNNSGMPMLAGSITSADWYFYNNLLKTRGAGDFQRKWGTRKLEDNWRRSNKASVNIDENTDEAALTDENPNIPEPSQKVEDSFLSSAQKVEYYLQQIPVTEAQLKKSDDAIADALFSMAGIYKNKLNEPKSALKMIVELERRFPTASQLCDAYFWAYQLTKTLQQETEANAYRTRIIQQFPDSKYALILSQSNYAEKLNEMYLIQDSLYQKTYLAYTKGDFTTVFNTYQYISTNYPLSPLLPKFGLLNALSIGKTQSAEVFETELKTLLKAYPESDISTLAKDIIALMAQGREAQKGTTHGTLLEKRNMELTQAAGNKAIQFDATLQQKHLFVILLPASIDINKLLYNIATYNFTGFLIKDFDLNTGKYDQNTNILTVSNFENLNEGLWYQNGLLADKTVGELLKQSRETTYFVISESNFELLKTTFSPEQYAQFFQQQLAPKETKIPQKKPTPAPTVVELVDISKKNSTESPIVRQESEALVTTPQTDTNAKPTNSALPKFRNLYTYDEGATHSYAILLLKDRFDFTKIKAAFDKYNAENYAIANLTITIEQFGANRIIFINSFPNANAAKSYLLRIVKETQLYEALQEADYRNLIGTKDNFDVLKKTGTLSIYIDFMREFYLK